MIEQWVATCGVCRNTFEHPDRPSEGSLQAGTLCPECRERRYTCVGVLSWRMVHDEYAELKRQLLEQYEIKGDVIARKAAQTIDSLQYRLKEAHGED